MNPLKILAAFMLLFVINACDSETLEISEQNKETLTKEKTETLIKSEFGSPQYESGCSDKVKSPLTGGQHIDVGTLEVSNDEDYIYVTYDVNETFSGNNSDWYLKETHLFVGCSADEIPTNEGGNPMFGHFPYSEDHELVKSFTYKIPLTEFDCDTECLIISAHSSVVTLDDTTGEQDQDETAFGGCDDNSSEFPGNRWGCWFSFCPQDCKVVVSYMYKKGYTDRLTCFEDDFQGETIYGMSNRFGYPDSGVYLTPPGVSFPVDSNFGEDCDLTEVEQIGTVTFFLGDYENDPGITLAFKGSNGYEKANGVWTGLVSWINPISWDDGELKPGLELDWFELNVVNGEAEIYINEAKWPGNPRAGASQFNQFYLISKFVLDK